MNSFIKRSISGTFYVLFIIIFLFTGPLTYYILFSGFLIIGLLELLKLLESDLKSIWKITNILLPFILFTSSFFDASGIFKIPFFVILSAIVIIILLSKLFTINTNIIENSGKQFFIYLYLTLPISLSNYLVFYSGEVYKYNYHILLNIFILLWCSDTGAYLAGSAFGKHSFFKSISPKKTWEGFIGGVLLTLIASYIISKLNEDLNLYNWLIIGALTAIFGTFGDLVESMLKRKADVKDSGNIFPGHGGLLDRIDSFLIAVLAVFVYIKLFEIF